DSDPVDVVDAARAARPAPMDERAAPVRPGALRDCVARSVALERLLFLLLQHHRRALARVVHALARGTAFAAAGAHRVGGGRPAARTSVADVSRRARTLSVRAVNRRR